MIKYVFVEKELCLSAQQAAWTSKKSVDTIKNHHIPINVCSLHLTSIAIAWKPK
jgi:hypothetical protein